MFDARHAHQFASDFIQDVDGFFYYYVLPESKSGTISAYTLRQIADLLDWVNEPWQANIEAYFEEERRKEEQAEADRRLYDQLWEKENLM
jgi:hypothetical protein